MDRRKKPRNRTLFEIINYETKSGNLKMISDYVDRLIKFSKMRK